MWKLDRKSPRRTWSRVTGCPTCYTKKFRREVRNCETRVDRNPIHADATQLFDTVLTLCDVIAVRSALIFCGCGVIMMQVFGMFCGPG